MMVDAPPDWPEPRVTANAQLLLGYVAEALMHVDDSEYAIVDVEVRAGRQILKHRVTETRFRMTIEQIGGVE